MQALFWNLESDITMVAAFVFAHDQAQKGLVQLLHILANNGDDGGDDDGDGDGDAPAAAQEPPPMDEYDIVEEARSSFSRPSNHCTSCECLQRFWATGRFGLSITAASQRPQF